MIRWLPAVLSLCTSAGAVAQTGPQGLSAGPGFEPNVMRSAVPGDCTEIMVLASAHLVQSTPTVEAAWLEPLLERLEAFRPHAIAVERLTGETLYALSAYRAVYPGVTEMFGGSALDIGPEIQAAVGLDMPAAEAAMRETLAGWPAAPRPAERRRLIALMLAAGDPASAVVQWSRLPTDERQAADGLTEAAAARLDRLMSSRNEIYSLAVRLAARLGLERVHPIDDHSDADLVLPIIDRVDEAESDAEFAALRARHELPRTEPMTSPHSILDAYRRMNSPAFARAQAAYQALPWLLMSRNSQIHRRRAAAWETRNMRMAAHIREASGLHPGERILVIVGSAHKPWLDLYLERMSDVCIADAESLLAAS